MLHRIYAAVAAPPIRCGRRAPGSSQASQHPREGAEVSQAADRVCCPRCGGLGTVAAQKVQPWKTWQDRELIAKAAKPGDRWIQIKSGRVTVVQRYLDGRYNTLELKHENGRVTTKWLSYFAQEFTPETPPHE